MLSKLLLPLIVLFIVVYGIIKKVNVYDVFIDGAKESFEMFVSLFPPMLGMILAINLFKVIVLIISYLFYHQL